MYYLEPAVVALAAVGSAAVGVVAVGSVVDDVFDLQSKPLTSDIFYGSVSASSGLPGCRSVFCR